MENQTVTGPGIIMAAMSKLEVPPHTGTIRGGGLFAETLNGVVDVATITLAKHVHVVCAQETIWIRLENQLPETIATALVGRPATQVIDHPLLAESGHQITAVQQQDETWCLWLDYRSSTLAAKTDKCDDRIDAEV